MIYNKRYLARIVLEGETPLKIGSGEKDPLFQSPLFTDANGVPQIPGTSLAGLLRHSLEAAGCEKERINALFGFQKPGDDDMGQGSRVLLSPGLFMIQKERVVEEVMVPGEPEAGFLKELTYFPVRDHCRISSRGCADTENRGKFEESLVPRGARFKMELEFLSREGSSEDENNWRKILGLMSHPSFRLGGGTRKGFGKMKILSLKTKVYHLKEKSSREAYLNRSASLNIDPPGIKKDESKPDPGGVWKTYRLTLEPEDVYLFASGQYDPETDLAPKYEKIIEWEDGRPRFSEKKILIPGTSLKGALSHRTAFHYNRRRGVFADRLDRGDDGKGYTGEENEAVKALFGCAREKKEGQVGNVICEDIFLDNAGKTKIFNHVAIDRFTGGARRGALFAEKVIDQKDRITLDLLVNQKALENEEIKASFEDSLDDLTGALLPLGGSVMKGHGLFKGHWELLEEQKGKV